MVIEIISVSSLFMIAYKNISRKKIRTILSVFGIILGILLYTSMSIASTSFKKEITASISYLQGSIFIQQKDAPTPVLSVIDRKIEYDIKENLSEIVEEVSPQIWFVNGTTFSLRTMVILGVFPEKEMKVGGYIGEAEFANGMPPRDNDTGWVVVGDGISRLLGLKIGDNITIGSAPNNLTLRVIGLFKTGGFADFFAIASIKDISKVDKFRDMKKTVSSLVVRLKDPRFVKDFKNYVKERYPSVDLIMEKDLINRASFILSNVEKFVLLVSGLALLIGVLGVTNTVFMNVSERRKEIGILKATGWDNLEIITEVMFESLIIGFIGTTMGVVLGILGVFIAVDYFNITIRVSITISDIIKPFLAGFMISVIAGVPPAWRAMNISPIESLRE